MAGNKIFLSIVSLLLLFSVAGYLFVSLQEVKTKSEKPDAANHSQPVIEVSQRQLPKKKSYDLYSETPYDLPLFSIVEISKLDSNIKAKVDKLLEASQGFYFLRQNKGGVFIIFQNPITESKVYSRHDLQFGVISPEGEISYHIAGYCGVDGESELANTKTKDETWFFDKKNVVPVPSKHIVYNENGKVKFTEYWYYLDEPVKYEMKGVNGEVVSVLKEIQDTETNLRREHVFYDNNGLTKMSLSVNYAGANVSRLTFYNSHDLIDGVSIITEYSNGLKIKESVYDEDYNLVKTITASYTDDGVRENISVYDSNGNLLDTISSK